VQIDAQANEPFTVEKQIDTSTTFNKIRKLTKQDKVLEIAKLLSGEKVPEAFVKSAKKLINN
jgi:DNA repair protein RecN (Recombination protein N)